MKAFILSCMMFVTACGVSQSYGANLFETTSHNFGTVLKGAKTEFDFVFTNPYNQPLVVETVATSCQCTSPSVSPGVLQPGQKGSVHISVNTKSFQGNKNATITVRFSRPYRMEVQLHSYVFIRNDVSINPGLVYFGTVTAGAKPSIQVQVNSVNSNWMIRDVTSGCKFLSVVLPEPVRNYNGTSYLMTITLGGNAKPGPFSEVLELVTNDSSPSAQRIPIRVEGRVKDTLNINPSSLSFGLVNVGEKSTKVLIVQGSSNFQIKDITSESPYISATIETSKNNLRTILLTYNAKEEGEFKGNINVFTDLEGKTETSIPFYGKAIAKKVEEPKPEVTPEALPEPASEIESEIEKAPEEPNTAEVPEVLPETLPETVPEEETVPESLELPLDEEEIQDGIDMESEKKSDLEVLEVPEVPVPAEKMPVETSEVPEKPALELPAPEEQPAAAPEELPNALPLPENLEDDNASNIMEILPSDENDGIFEIDTDPEAPVEELPEVENAPEAEEFPEVEDEPEVEIPANFDSDEDILDEDILDEDENAENADSEEEIEIAPEAEAPKKDVKGRNLLKTKDIQ